MMNDTQQQTEIIYTLRFIMENTVYTKDDIIVYLNLDVISYRSLCECVVEGDKIEELLGLSVVALGG